MELVQNSAKEFYGPQRQIANCLELASMTACRHAEVAGKVRQTSHYARTEQLFSLGLLQKLKVTAQHIIDKLIPYIEMGVNNKDPQLVLAAIKKTSKYITDMELKSSETVKSYNALQEKLLEMQLYLKNKQEDIEEEKKKLTRDIEKQKQLLQLAITKKEEKESDKDKLTKKMEDMNIKHEGSMKRVDQDFEKGISSAKNPNFFDGIIGAGVLLTTFACGPGALFVGAAYAGLRGIATPIIVNRAIKQKNEILLELQTQNAEEQRRLRLEITEANKSIIECRYETLELEAKSSTLEDKKAALVDARQIEEANTYASRLGCQFTVMQLFWQKMVEQYVKMEMKITSNEMLISNEAYGGVIKKECQEALTDWKIIRDICSDYERMSASELTKNYNFMAVQFDTMPTDAVEKRKQDLIASVESVRKELN